MTELHESPPAAAVWFDCFYKLGYKPTPLYNALNQTATCIHEMSGLSRLSPIFVGTDDEDSFIPWVRKAELEYPAKRLDSSDTIARKSGIPSAFPQDLPVVSDRLREGRSGKA